MNSPREAKRARLTEIVLLALFMVARWPGAAASAEGARAATAIKHKPLKHFVSGHRIRVAAVVTDPEGVSLARCYFKAAGQADYVFVGMRAAGGDQYAGILPSPAAASSIEYLFLVVNGKSRVVRTQAFRVERTEDREVPPWQQVEGDGAVQVGGELPQSTAPAGFVDAISFDVVESGARFGVVAGVYDALQGAGGGVVATGAAGASSTGSAAGASSAGIVVVDTGMSKTAIIVTSAAVAVAVAGVAVVTGGASGSGQAVCANLTGCRLSDPNGPMYTSEDCVAMKEVCAGKDVEFVYGVALPSATTPAEWEAYFVPQTIAIRLDGSPLSVRFDGTHRDSYAGFGDIAHANWTATPGSHTVVASWSQNGGSASCSFTISR